MGTRPHRQINYCRVHNRIPALMAHIPWYTFRCQARLAADAGVSEPALSRLLLHQSSPSYVVADAVIRALERRLGREIPTREVFSLDGTYPTATICQLLGCRNCTPPRVYESDDFSTVKPGEFSRPEPVEGAA